MITKLAETLTLNATEHDLNPTIECEPYAKAEAIELALQQHFLTQVDSRALGDRLEVCFRTRPCTLQDGIQEALHKFWEAHLTSYLERST